MPRERERARVLLGKAAEDHQVMVRLLEPPAVGPSVIGLHAQQAIEKALKAVLTARHREYPKTHDLIHLLTLFDGTKVTPPPHSDRFSVLLPFAAAYRYDYTEAGQDLDWPAVLAQVEDILAWARAQVDAGGAA